MQNEAAVLNVRVLVQVVNAIGVEQRGATLDAVNNIAFLEQKLGEIGSILTSDASNESGSFFHWGSSLRFMIQTYFTP